MVQHGWWVVAPHLPAALRPELSLSQPLVVLATTTRSTPSDLPLKGLQYQTLCAREMDSLLAGQRGVVMVQLWVGWDAAAPQPVHNCLVVHGLQRALARKDVSIFMSSAAGKL